MYNITKNDKTLVVISEPIWVVMQDNGSFTLCDKRDAQGIVIDGVVYHIHNTPEIPGHDTVIVTELSETEYRRSIADKQAAQQLQTESALAELSILIAGMMNPPTTV